MIVIIGGGVECLNVVSVESRVLIREWKYGVGE